MKFCTGCWRVNEDNAKTCVGCGRTKFQKIIFREVDNGNDNGTDIQRPDRK